MYKGVKEMKKKIPRRDFLKAVPSAVFMMALAGKGTTFSSSLFSSSSSSRIKLEPFDYQGVWLLKSRWQEQYQSARDFYLGISNDDILKGFREAAGLHAPGKTLGGWCRKNSSTVFGQLLSGMSRMYRATGDSAMREKAMYLMTEFAKTVKPNGDCGMRHYAYDKLVCGLVDMQKYADCKKAIILLEKITDWARKTLSRENIPATPKKIYHYYGKPQEWYTLSENLYRAYQLTGNPMFKDFAKVWLYHQYWNKFADKAAPADAHGVHAYSHVNAFSSAAMAYAVKGDPVFLQIIKNAYDYMQDKQCFATGGYGPVEHFVSSNGSLGRSLETRYDTFETSCGSWAGFKLSRYLMQFTGEARYGDWIERLLYNGIGAALPIAEGGKNFYYSDYRVGGGMKVYNWDTFTCCSGTYIQNVADYHNLIYFKNNFGIFVNLYVPSEVIFNRPEGEVKLVQDTCYPEEETSTLTLQMKQAMDFQVSFRVPGWAKDVSVNVNGSLSNIRCQPGSWASVRRTWNPGDRLEIKISLKFRKQPVDRWHPHRVAVVRGPVVMVQDASHQNPEFRLPEEDDEMNRWLVPTDEPGTFRLEPLSGRPESLRMLPFYSVGEAYPYRMYFDLRALPEILW